MIKYKLSFVQGRLSPQIGSIYQYFPVDNWQNELMEAKKIGLNNIEWIVSDLSNPIFNSNFLKIILINLKKNKINILMGNIKTTINRKEFLFSPV